MSKEITNVSIDILKVHPRNAEFFDDISGDSWRSFLFSVSMIGIVNPIIITPQNVIVSGYQRVRACKELGIPTIPAYVKSYEDEDDIVRDMLEINAKQRKNLADNTVKLEHMIFKLSKICGIARMKSVYLAHTRDGVLVGYSKDFERRKMELPDEIIEYYVSPMCCNYTNIVKNFKGHFCNRLNKEKSGNYYIIDFVEAVSYIISHEFKEE